MKEYANIIQKHFTERRRIEKSAKKKFAIKRFLFNMHFLRHPFYLENVDHMCSTMIIGFLAAISTKKISSYVYFHTMK